ncbi:MAG: EAL domain-containing protein [Candidatus Contendobacter sp.]|nr:EAL domain-containing protein [Candidatus Contendobacter sp.]MDG4558660.1 EAL domain-containing protein [Candidatus Contendobacter sp.]
MNNGTARILVVDDDPTIRLLAREVLERNGYVVAEAENGSQALRHFAATGGDLVLLDVMMPELDGFATCQQLRQMPTGSQVPIVMMTGLEDSVSIQRAYDAGATDFIVKPIIWSILAQRVRYILRASNALREVAGRAAFQRALIETMPLPILVEDAQGHSLTCNPAFETLFGGRSLPRPTESVSGDQARLQVYEADMLSAHQDRRAVIIHRTTFTPPGSSEAGFISAILDITERKQNEERQRLAETVFQTAASAIMVTDPTGIVQSVNPAFTTITGYSGDEAIGKTPSLLKSDRHDAQFYAGFWGALAETGHWSGEMWQRRKNGQIYPAWVSVKAVRDADGQVVQYVAFFSDITERKLAEQEIFFRANYDPLTGLPNRSLLHERIDQALRRVRRHGGGLALMFLDLDRFKQVNDTLGHAWGDELLCQTAERLEACVRETDTVARYSGDEFILLLPGIAHLSNAYAIAEKVIQRISQPFDLNNTVIQIGCSIGIVLYPDHGSDVGTLLRHADLAMYQAKTSGRNTYRRYEPVMADQMLRQLSLETDLRLAIQHHELMVYYQPVLNLKSNRLAGAEALIRWRHPRRGLVSPGDFIPLAEETGLIHEIGAWVLENVCQTLGRWCRKGWRAPISVNLSSVQILHGLTVESVETLLQRHALRPEWLAFEITESVLIHDTRQAQQWLEAIRGLGIRVDIDDFGTGYSSLAYLKRFPIDRLKIDQSFVRDIAANANDRALVEAILAMAGSLRIPVVAEGVENQEQLDLLRRLGCEYAQGFYFSKPVPAEEFVQFAGRLGAFHA